MVQQLACWASAWGQKESSANSVRYLVSRSHCQGQPWIRATVIMLLSKEKTKAGPTLPVHAPGKLPFAISFKS